MRRVLALLIVLLATPAQADIDERWVRDGANGVVSQSMDMLKAVTGFKPFRRSFAVVIGVSDYDNGWDALEAPKYDVQRMSTFLKGQGAFDVVYTITDGAATRERIRTLMVETLPAEVGTDDRVLFYFSGHGTERKLYDDRVLGYLVLKNSGSEGYASMIDMNVMENWWQGIAQARQSLFILDACFSGLGLQIKGAPVFDRTVADLSKRGHHLITAGTEDQLSRGNLRKWGGSLFTDSLIRGMQGRADSQTVDHPKDGIVSLKELWDYTKKRVRAHTKSGDMTPQYASFEDSNDGEFFFIADPEAAQVALALPSPTDDNEEKGSSKAAAAWDAIKDGDDVTAFHEFLRTYPKSPFAIMAVERIVALATPYVPPNEQRAVDPVKPSPSAITTMQAEPYANEEGLSLADERFVNGVNAARDGNMTAAVRYYKLAIAAEDAHAGARAELAALYARGDVNGRIDYEAALGVLESCSTPRCQALRSEIESSQRPYEPE